MRVLILGGGSVGGKLALDLTDSFVLIESDPSRVWELKEILKENPVEHTIIHGDGSTYSAIEAASGEFDAAVVLMNRDFENLEAVSALKKYKVPRIIARVNRPSNMAKFIEMGAEVFNHPIGYEEGLIRTMLYPDRSHAIQIFVREGSPAVGKSIRELELPEGAVVGSILRGESMIPPESDLRIAKGDLIAIDTVGKRARKVWKIFSRRGKVESSGHILFPLTKDRDLVSLKEVEILAKKMSSEIIFIVQPGKEGLLKAAQGFISKRITFEVISTVSEKECILEDDRKLVKWQRMDRKSLQIQSIMESHANEGSPHVDILAISPPRREIIYVPFFSTAFDRMVEKAPMPVLITRNSKPYRKILIYLHRDSAFEINMAIQMARATGATITAITKRKNRRKAQYIQRFAQVYDVKVEVLRILGNPTVEIIREARNNHYDLLIIKSNLRELQLSQMRRLIHLWTGSVLVVP